MLMHAHHLVSRQGHQWKERTDSPGKDTSLFIFRCFRYLHACRKTTPSFLRQLIVSPTAFAPFATCWIAVGHTIPSTNDVLLHFTMNCWNRCHKGAPRRREVLLRWEPTRAKGEEQRNPTLSLLGSLMGEVQSQEVRMLQDAL